MDESKINGDYVTCDKLREEPQTRVVYEDKQVKIPTPNTFMILKLMLGLVIIVLLVLACVLVFYTINYFHPGALYYSIPIVLVAFLILFFCFLIIIYMI